MLVKKSHDLDDLDLIQCGKNSVLAQTDVLSNLFLGQSENFYRRWMALAGRDKEKRTTG